ncbi:MAG TPA: SIS domain-containing protein, partial [Candidatus Nanopelagicales bacterium]|nr:SIS domain-containing protein [Candidatus Nanopelagicales bacterium]
AAEIAEQPEVFERILRDGAAAAAGVGRVLRERHPRFVLFAARGTSDHAALYAKYLVELRLGLPAGLASPSTLTAYGARPDLRDVLLVAVSQSGGSPDLVETVSVARACGALTLAVTNAGGSDLANAAELHLDVMAGTERAVAATKSYTAELLTLWLVVQSVLGEGAGGAAGVPAAAAALVARTDEVDALSARYRFTDRIVLTGRGYAFPTALEGALKLMETSYVAAHAFSGADLLHGPLAMIDSDHPVLAVVPAGVGEAAMRPVLERLHERGADLTVLGGPASLGFATVGFDLAHGLREDLAPLVDVIPLQQLALSSAVARGYDPDRPRGLSKVTETW